MKIYFSVSSIGKCLGAFLNVVTWLTILVLNMVLYLCVLVIYNLVQVFYLFTYVISWVWDSGVSALIVPILFFDISLLLGASAEILLGFYFLLRSPVGFLWV